MERESVAFFSFLAVGVGSLGGIAMLFLIIHATISYTYSQSITLLATIESMQLVGYGFLATAIAGAATLILTMIRVATK